jgi:hypothetical protein
MKNLQRREDWRKKFAHGLMAIVQRRSIAVDYHAIDDLIERHDLIMKTKMITQNQGNEDLTRFVRLLG